MRWWMKILLVMVISAVAGFVIRLYLDNLYAQAWMDGYRSGSFIEHEKCAPAGAMFEQQGSFDI